MKYIKYTASLISLVILTTFSQAQDAEVVVLDSASTSLNADEMVNLPFAQIEKNRVIGATASVGQQQLATTDLNVAAALIGKIPGLIVNKSSASPGRDDVGITIRGRNSFSNNAPLVVVDGISNRTLQSLNFYEIESITVLKDATAKILYGAQAANGVILVTTKRGRIGESGASFNAETGIRKPTHFPKFLNSFDYATLYNEAAANDGATTPVYSTADLEGYKQGGENDTNFPNVDFHGRYVKPLTKFSRLYGTYSNASENAALFFSGGYVGENGLEAIGKQTSYHRVNVRGNLDYQINNIFSVQMDIAARIESGSSHNMGYAGFFSNLSSHRPNEYFIYRTDDNQTVTDQLGWSSRVGNNIEGDLTRAGYTDDLYRQGQTNLGLKADLSDYVDGLSFKGYLTFDTYNFVATGKTDQYARYNKDGDKLGDDVESTGISQKGNGFYRNTGLVTSIDYTKDIGKSALTTNLFMLAQMREFNAGDTNFPSNDNIQPDKNLTFGYRMNYAYEGKYIAELDLAYMGSNKLQKDNRFGLFPAIGFGWVASKESFLENSDVINFLKLRSSFGIVGYDVSINHFLYRDSYGGSGNAPFGPTNSTNFFANDVNRTGNPSIGFEKSKELNVGIDATLFDRLSIDANYYSVNRTDIPMQLGSQYPDYFGDVIPVVNFGQMTNKGIELALNYSAKTGSINYNIGGYITHSKATYTQLGEIEAFDHLKSEGKHVDAIWGYKSEGFYNNDSEVNVNSTLGNVMAGDLRYQDLTGDGIISAEDRTIIGNSDPRYIYALNFNVGFKGLNLFLLGQGNAGGNRMMNGIRGNNGANEKYRSTAFDRWTPDNTTASHPRLSTTSTHSYQASTFWMESASYFTIRNVELSYTFPSAVKGAIKASNLRLFLRGTDVLTMSKNSEVNADNAWAGYFNAPLMKTYSIGVNLSY